VPPLQFTRPETNRYDGVSGVCQVRSSIESFRQFTVIEDTTEMLSVTGSGLSLCDGHSRREWMRIGSVGMAGLSLPTLLQARATATNASLDGAFGKAKSVILFGLTGGAPQHETFDPKPEAPENIRGEFGVINSRTSGLYVGELMPRTSALTDRIAVLRAVVTGDNAHSSSGYQMLTGVAHQPLNRESAQGQGRRVARVCDTAGTHLERWQFSMARTGCRFSGPAFRSMADEMRSESEFVSGWGYAAARQYD
jgi:hypothetical protein